MFANRFASMEKLVEVLKEWARLKKEHKNRWDTQYLPTGKRKNAVDQISLNLIGMKYREMNRNMRFRDK